MPLLEAPHDAFPHTIHGYEQRNYHLPKKSFCCTENIFQAGLDSLSQSDSKDTIDWIKHAHLGLDLELAALELQGVCENFDYKHRN